MELPGANYLYALATISVTFVGFSALLLVFRQTIGGKMTSYDSYFTLAFMQAGFIVAAWGAVAATAGVVWDAACIRLASVERDHGHPLSLFVAMTPRRRRAATNEPIPFYVGLLLLLQFLAGICLLFNAVGWPVPPNPAPFALALTVMLFTTGIAYLIALAHALGKNRDQG